MKCRHCGADLRPDDHFCSSCGMPVDWEDDQQGEQTQIYSQWEGEDDDPYHIDTHRKAKKQEDVLYDKKVFRDTFLDRTEEGHQALLVTLLVLVLVATVTLCAVALITRSRRSASQDTGSALTLTETDGMAAAEETPVVIIIDEASQPESTADMQSDSADAADSENTAQLQGEDQASAQDDSAEASQPESTADAQSDSQTDAQPQTETETQSEIETAAQQQMQADMSQLSTQISQIMEDASGADTYGIYISDLTGGQICAAGSSDVQMLATATVTVPILYTAAVTLDQGSVTLDDEITYVNSIGGRGEANPEERDGQNYPLSFYLTTMLRYSDNNCINCLIDFFTMDVINSVCHESGFASVDIQRKIVDVVTDGSENYVSAQDLTGMVKQLVQGSFAVIDTAFMQENFRIDTSDSAYTVIGLAASLPEGITLLNQNGKGDTRFAECALISDGTVSYVITVMCSGESGFLYEEAVKEVSELVYLTMTGAV